MELMGIFFLAVFVEGTVEYFVAPALDKRGLSEYVKYVAVAVGIALCIVYQVDILTRLPVNMTPVHPSIGWIISGIIMGRGSNYFNDFIGLARGDGGHDPEHRFRKTSFEDAKDDIGDTSIASYFGVGNANDK